MPFLIVLFANSFKSSLAKVQYTGKTVVRKNGMNAPGVEKKLIEKNWNMQNVVRIPTEGTAIVMRPDVKVNLGFEAGVGYDVGED